MSSVVVKYNAEENVFPSFEVACASNPAPDMTSPLLGEYNTPHSLSSSETSRLLCSL